MAKFSEQEIDSILASVDDALAKAQTLAKAAPMCAPAANGGGISAGGAPKTPSGASQAQPAGDPMKKPISAEAPKSSGGVSMAQKPDPMKKDGLDPSKPEDQAPGAEAGAAPEAAPPGAEMGKSEGAAGKRLEAVEAENANLRKSLEKVVSAMEIAFRPERKAVTSLEYIKKGEDNGVGGEVKELSKSDLTAILTEKSKSPSLTKNDREAINDYILRGGSKERVLEIVKGGK